jgi:DNA polymerase III delta prime subunit
MSYILNNPSHEQKNVLLNLKYNNVVCDSVAGSGKTTTILYIAKTFKSKSILLLTYNAKLKIETREKVKLLNLTNIEVHSYHSFCVKYYDRTTFTDTKIKAIVDNDKNKLSTFTYDIIVIDEVQDMTPLYYNLVCKIFYDNNCPVSRICITGDKYQSIYDFNLADERYILFAPELFKFNKKEWKKINLSTSFRLTQENADFINNCIINEDRIKSIKSNGFKPRYIICNTFIKCKEAEYAKYQYYKSQKDDLTTYNEILYYLDLGYKPEDIFILAPSVKGSASPIRVLSNKLSVLNKNINVFIPVGDDEKIDKDVLRDKLVFSSYHQAKGLERKVVIVFGVDSSYFTYFKQNAVDTICPNEIYVALTRSLERLTIFHNYTSKYIPFINIENIPKYTEFITNGLDIENHKRGNIRNINVNDLTKYVPEEIISKCMQYVTIDIIDVINFNNDNPVLMTDKIQDKNIDKIDEKNYNNKYIDIPLKIKEKGNYENVEDITSIMLLEYYNFMKTQSLSCLDKINELIKKESNKFYSNYNKITNNFGVLGILEFITNLNTKMKNKQEITITDFLKLSTIWNGIESDLLFKIKQITQYDWITQNHIDECIKRLEWINKDYKNSTFNNVIEAKKISLKNIIEKNKNLINVNVPNTDLFLNIKGYIEKISIDKNQIFKFICKDITNNLYIIQIILLYHIYILSKKLKKERYTMLIFNILTNDMKRVNIEFKNVEEIFNILVCNKYVGMKQLTQNSFIKNNLDNYNKYFE